MVFDTAADIIEKQWSSIALEQPGRREVAMGLIGIVIMWVVTIVALIIVNYDRFWRMYKEREKQWRKYN